VFNKKCILCLFLALVTLVFLNIPLLLSCLLDEHCAVTL